MCCRFTRVFYCCAKRRRIERIFKKARVFNGQELNIAAIIKGSRQSEAACQILRKTQGFYDVEPVIEKLVKRGIYLSEDEDKDKPAVSEDPIILALSGQGPH